MNAGKDPRCGTRRQERFGAMTLSCAGCLNAAARPWLGKRRESENATAHLTKNQPPISSNFCAKRHDLHITCKAQSASAVTIATCAPLSLSVSELGAARTRRVEAFNACALRKQRAQVTETYGACIAGTRADTHLHQRPAPPTGRAILGTIYNFQIESTSLVYEVVTSGYHRSAKFLKLSICICFGLGRGVHQRMLQLAVCLATGS